MPHKIKSLSTGKGHRMEEKRYESDLTRKEKRHLEWEKIKGMKWKARIGYIWEYYKPHMAVGLGIILVLCIIGQIIYRSQFETVLSVAVLNSPMGDSEGMAADFKKYLKDTDKFHEITVDSSMIFGGDGQSDYTSTMKLTTLIGAQELDVLVAPEEQFNHYTEMEAFFPMDEILTEEEKEAYGDAVTEYGIRIGNTEKLQEFQMTVGEDAYLAVFINTENVENAKSFIKYIYGGGES
jgi:hypothetical protein